MSKEQIEELFNTCMSTLKQREEQYNNGAGSLQMIADLWTIYTHNVMRVRDELYVSDICNMMILLKIVRNCLGEKHDDNFVDMIGYTALGYVTHKKNTQVPTK